MKSLISACLIAMMLVVASFDTSSAAPSFNAKSPEQKHAEMLYPLVSVEASNGNGSGTVIYSKAGKKGWETFILTNHHVISSAISVEQEWDPRKKKKIDIERRTTVNVRWFIYNKLSRFVGTSGKVVDIVAYDRAADLALLKVRDSERGVKHVAYLRPWCEPIYLFDPVYAVGAGLGKPPFATEGTLGLFDEEIQGYRYLLATAPIIYGNSGGALFRWDTPKGRFEMIGVPSQVSVTWTSVISHMAWNIPRTTIWEFLKKNKLDRILPSGCPDPK